MANRKSLSHIDDRGRPTMVDVSGKAASARSAIAECDVRFPPEVAEQLRAQGLRSAKGPIVDTAIVAGVMAAKRTHELIPFCHPLALERIDLAADFVDATTLRIRCVASLTGKTGVEMEALVGATLAALTVYDMTKALSHAIEIGPARLVEKRGGKSPSPHPLPRERGRGSKSNSASKGNSASEGNRASKGKRNSGARP